MSRLKSWARIGAYVTCALVASQVRADDVRGTVRSGEEPKARAIEAVRAPYWQEWNGFIDPKKPSVDLAREVSAVLIGPSDTRDSVTVVLRQGTLTPSTIVAQHGTTLRVRNEDDFAHELFADKLKDFEPKTLGPGQTRSIALGETGVFALGDKLAPHVHGFLHVVAKVSYVTSPASDGSFSFKEVPPGSYVLKVFRGANELPSRELEVQSKGDLTVDPIDVQPSAVKAGK
ncbi:MAG: cupredoxin domain-containing protein [Polyangiales bacterium]